MGPPAHESSHCGRSGPVARHSNGESNPKLAGWLWAVIVLAIVAIIGAAVYFMGGGSDDQVAASSDKAATSETPRETALAETPSATTTASEDEASESAASETSGTDSPTARPSAESSTPAASPSPSGPSPENTLLLFDTSDGMTGFFAPVSNSLAETAQDLGGEGKQVAVWNYSSPLSPGVQVGYRANLNFGPADAASGTVIRFGTGGVPQTRSAVVAAVANAADYAAQSGQPARVLLVTTGTAQDMDDAAFTEAFTGAAGGDVELSVVHVGEGAKDSALESVASHFETVADASEQASVAAAMKKAAGV